MSDTVERSARPAAWDAESVARFWDYWTRRHDDDEAYFSHARGPALISLARRFGLEARRVLDYGCARGALTEHLLGSLDATIEAADFSLETVRGVEARFAGRERWGGGHALDGLPSEVPADRFDLIYCIEVYEHLLDEWLAPTAAELYRLLAPGGAAIVSTPFDEDLAASQLYCPFCDCEFHRVQHVRRVGRDEMIDWLTAAGFRVEFAAAVDLSRFMPCSRMPVWSRRGLREYAGAVPSFVAAAAERFLPGRRPSLSFRVAAASSGPNLVAIARKPETSGNAD